MHTEYTDDLLDQSEPDCPYHKDGKHHYESDDEHDFRHSKSSTIHLKCQCGATATETEWIK